MFVASVGVGREGERRWGGYKQGPEALVLKEFKHL